MMCANRFVGLWLLISAVVVGALAIEEGRMARDAKTMQEASIAW